MEEANLEDNNPLLLPNEFLREAPEIIENNVSGENYSYSHQNASLIQDRAVLKSKEMSPGNEKQNKNKKIVDIPFFSKGNYMGKVRNVYKDYFAPYFQIIITEK